jgi:hypothetical protein
VLQQIEGILAYVDTLAPRSTDAHAQKIRASLLSAHTRLHEQFHRAGGTHAH